MSTSRGVRSHINTRLVPAPGICSLPSRDWLPCASQRQLIGEGDVFAEAPYTKIQMQRYIRYARAIKPAISQAAQAEIVSSYVRLRLGDAAPGTKTAYKITVRQLEALVR